MLVQVSFFEAVCIATPIMLHRKRHVRVDMCVFFAHLRFHHLLLLLRLLLHLVVASNFKISHHGRTIRASTLHEAEGARQFVICGLSLLVLPGLLHKGLLRLEEGLDIMVLLDFSDELTCVLQCDQPVFALVQTVILICIFFLHLLINNLSLLSVVERLVHNLNLRRVDHVLVVVVLNAVLLQGVF